MGNRLEGESRFVPNLQFELSETQLIGVSEALRKLESAHRTRVAWVGSYQIQEYQLSIHALDLLSAFAQVNRTSENEMEMFRLRRSAIEQLTRLLANSRNEIKKQNLQMWLDSYNKLWLGAEADRDLTQPPPQPSRIDLIP